MYNIRNLTNADFTIGSLVIPFNSSVVVRALTEEMLSEAEEGNIAIARTAATAVALGDGIDSETLTDSTGGTPSTTIPALQKTVATVTNSTGATAATELSSVVESIASLTDNSGGTSGGNTVAAATDTATIQNAIATLVAKVNALSAKATDPADVNTAIATLLLKCNALSAKATDPADVNTAIATLTTKTNTLAAEAVDRAKLITAVSSLTDQVNKLVSDVTAIYNQIQEMEERVVGEPTE